MKKISGFDFARTWDYENGFFLTSHPTRIAKLLAHYELYRSITGLPGHIVECGVYKGASFIRFATFRNLLESPYSRKLIGFDIFGKFPPAPDATDARFIAGFEQAGGPGLKKEELELVLEHKKIDNFELIPGDILDTVPAYVQSHPELKIALLHIDVDVYLPSMVCLQQLYSRVVKGGLVLFDDFGTVDGETRAVDEFFAGQDVRLEKLPISHIPAFIRK